MKNCNRQVIYPLSHVDQIRGQVERGCVAMMNPWATWFTRSCPLSPCVTCNRPLLCASRSTGAPGENPTELLSPQSSSQHPHFCKHPIVSHHKDLLEMWGPHTISWLRWQRIHRQCRRCAFDPWEDPLEKGMATHSRVLAWRIPLTEQPGELLSMGSLRVRYYWVMKYAYTINWCCFDSFSPTMLPHQQVMLLSAQDTGGFQFIKLHWSIFSLFLILPHFSEHFLWQLDPQ